MQPQRKDVAREIERQKEWLLLLERELRIDKDEEAIRSMSAEERALQETIQALQSNIQVLETQKIVYTTQKTWQLWTSARQKFRNLAIRSRLKRQRSRIFKVRKQLSSTTKAIEYLASSIVAAEVDVDTAKRSYYLRWGAEECCKANTEILSTTVEQLKQSQQEASAANGELEVVTALLEDCQTTKEQYHKKLEDLETKLQSTSQLIQEQYTEFRTIREKLCSVHIEIQEELCKAEVAEVSLSAAQESLPNVPQHPSTSIDVSSEMKWTVDLPINSTSVAEILKYVKCSRGVVAELLARIEMKLKGNRRTIEEQKEKIEQMMPLYKVGLDTRHRKFELDIKVKDSRPDWDIVHKGNEAAHYGRSLADATMCHAFCTTEKPHRYPGEFEDQYNSVPAKIVWEHRDFTKFHDILSWHMDMRQFGTGFKSATFDKEFKVLFSKIYPSLKWLVMRLSPRISSC